MRIAEPTFTRAVDVQHQHALGLPDTSKIASGDFVECVLEGVVLGFAVHEGGAHGIFLCVPCDPMMTVALGSPDRVLVRAESIVSCTGRGASPAMQRQTTGVVGNVLARASAVFLGLQLVLAVLLFQFLQGPGTILRCAGYCVLVALVQATPELASTLREVWRRRAEWRL